jgi:hypothetical protein
MVVKQLFQSRKSCFYAKKRTLLLINYVRGDLRQRITDISVSFSFVSVPDHDCRSCLGKERTMRPFRNPRNAIKKWRTRALFIDLHKTRITIHEEKKKHVPPWIFKQLAAFDQEKPTIVTRTPQ